MEGERTILISQLLPCGKQRGGVHLKLPPEDLLDMVNCTRGFEHAESTTELWGVAMVLDLGTIVGFTRMAIVDVTAS